MANIDYRGTVIQLSHRYRPIAILYSTPWSHAARCVHVALMHKVHHHDVSGDEIKTLIRI